MTHEEKIIEHLKTEKMLSVGELDCLLTTEDTETRKQRSDEPRDAEEDKRRNQAGVRKETP